jgi:putative heme iron utilization protein
MLKSTARAIRALLDGQRILSLAVLVNGAPFAGLLPFVPTIDYSGVIIHASRLSRHTAGLAAGVRAAVLLHEQDGPEKDPLQIKRASFECDVHPLERTGEEWTAERERYLARFPGSRITFRLSDFTLYRLEFRQGLWVGGFGRAVAIEPRDVAKLGSHGLT